MSDEAVPQDVAHWEALDQIWERMIRGQDPADHDTLPEEDLELLRQLCDAGKLHQQRLSSSEGPPSDGNTRHAQSLAQLDQWSGSRLDDYLLLAPIAHGGMGIVYRARQISLDRLVAVKLMRTGLFASAEEVRRFQSEALAAARLQHPGIVAIYSTGQVEGLHYYAMELVNGISLAQLQQQRATTNRQATLWIRELADAVDYAHQHNIVHRDLKPANVLIDEHGHLKVTDFGLSASLPAALSTSHVESPETNNLPAVSEQLRHLTRSGELLGTPAYMSPEQVLGDRTHIGPQTDVYALGVILYELLTGKPPFSAANAMETLQQVMASEPVSPRLVNPSVSRDLATLCLKCLEKRPADRLLSAGELVAECDRFLAGQPIKTRPIGWPTRVARLCRRNPMTTLLCSIVLLILLGSSLAGWYVARQLMIAERSALKAQQAASLSATAALQQRSLALQTINSLIESVESEFSRRADLLPVRQQMLLATRAKLQQVLDSGTNIDRDASVARAHARLANLMWLSGDAASAQTELQTALAIVQPLAAAGDREARSCYAYVLDELGNQHQMNHKIEQASECYQQSLTELELLLALDKESKPIRENTAFAYSRLGDIAYLKGDHARARVAYANALKTMAPVQESPEPSRRSLRLASRCHERLSWALAGLKEMDQAGHELQRALGFNEQLLKQDAADQQAMFDRCNLLYSQSDLQWRMSHIAEALTFAQQCVDVGDRMLERESHNAEMRWSHALHLEHLAKLQCASGDLAASLSSTGQSYDQLQQGIAEPGSPSAKFLQNTVTVSISGMQTAMRIGDQPAIHAWALRVIESVKQLNPPPNEAPLWQVATDMAQDADEGLQELSPDWQPTPGLLQLRPAARASGQCLAAYHQARQGHIAQSIQLVRQAAEYHPESLPLRYSHLACQALCWGLIASALTDTASTAEHTHALDQAESTLKAALQLNPAGREELLHYAELKHLRQQRPGCL